MTKQTINVTRLRRKTKTNKERIEKERAEAQARQEAEWTAAAEKPGRETAERVIKELPALLEEAASEGRNSTIAISIRSRVDRRAAEIIAEFCKKKGLQTEIKTYTAGVDDWDVTHDYLLVSW